MVIVHKCRSTVSRNIWEFGNLSWVKVAIIVLDYEQ